MKKIAVINLGSTSTKAAYFEDDICKFSESIPHPAEELRKFVSNWEQYDYRKEQIVRFFERRGVAVSYTHLDVYKRQPPGQPL